MIVFTLLSRDANRSYSYRSGFISFYFSNFAWNLQSTSYQYCFQHWLQSPQWKANSLFQATL